MSASHPALDVRVNATPRRTTVSALCSSGAQQHPRRKTQSALAMSVVDSLARSGKWAVWCELEPRLAGFADLDEARQGWRRRDERCYQVVAGLSALGSRRGGDDDDAALAVVVLLEEGVSRVAMSLTDVCELDDVNAAVWEAAKAAEPQVGSRAAEYLLKRAKQRLLRPAAGMIARVETSSLDQRLGWEVPGGGLQTGTDAAAHELSLTHAEIQDPVEDLSDLLTWAREVGVIATEEVDLLLELLAAENAGMAREEAQRVVGERHGVAMRTIRRRRDRTAEQLRDAVPSYLAATA